MSIRRGLGTFLILGRVSNLPTIWSNVIAGWFLSGGGWGGELAWIMLGMSLFYLAGMTLNDVFDEKWDREHATHRPIPSGRITATRAWVVGIVLMAAGYGVLSLGTTVHPLLVCLLLAAIILYNWLHKKWKGSVIIMGVCRAFVYVGAGSAVAAQTLAIELPLIVAVLAIAVVLYVAGITLAARDEHLESPAGPSFLHRILLMLPVLFPLLGFRTVPDDAINIALVVVGVFGIWAWIVLVRRGMHRSVPRGVAMAIAGIAFYDAAIVVFADWMAAVVCLACFVLTIAGQRFVPGT